MNEPSVKGLLVGGVVVNLQRLRESGRLAADACEARLSRAALHLLEEKIDPSRWYPLAEYAELVDLLWDHEAARDPEYMREKGRAWAKKLYDAHRYQQLEYADASAGAIGSPEEAVRQGRLIASLIGTFWSFVEAEVDLDPERPHTLRLVLSGRLARLFPEANRFTTEGFLNHMVERTGGRHRSTSERPAPDRLEFRLELRLG
jgi:hypothetical protein